MEPNLYQKPVTFHMADLRLIISRGYIRSQQCASQCWPWNLMASLGHILTSERVI